MKRVKLAAFLTVVWLLVAAPFTAAQYSSSGYQTNETLFGTGGDLNVSSPNYKAQASVGALGVGDFFSANYRSNAGFLTQNEVFIEMGITQTTIDLGTLTTTSPGTGSGSFYVRSYLSTVYNVLTMSQPLTNEEGYVIKNLTSPTASSPGTEQFGMNLVKNANFCGAGCDLGANLVNQPDNTFADGQVATGYNTANVFKYVPGDIIARSPATNGNQAIGQTTYTISYIANRSTITPAGLYTMKHDIVAVGTF
jgi:hypothetical protein